MTLVVVDASVAVKWLLPEVHSAAARAWFTVDHLLVVPDLVFAEVGNVLSKRVRRGEMTGEQAKDTWTTFALLPLDVHPARPLGELALEIALATGQTVYDGMYLALAVQEACRLVTADRRLFNALQGGPFGERVAWVEKRP